MNNERTDIQHILGELNMYIKKYIIEEDGITSSQVREICEDIESKTDFELDFEGAHHDAIWVVFYDDACDDYASLGLLSRVGGSTTGLNLEDITIRDDDVIILGNYLIYSREK